MIYLYNFLLYALYPVAWLILVKKYGIKYFSLRQNVPVKGEFDFIIHGASLGEQRLIVPLIEELSKKGFKILLTAATDTGLKEAVKKFSNYPNISINYFPFDLMHSVNNFFSNVKAEKIILVETELWPNSIRVAAKKGMKLFLINGRISNKTFNTYKRFAFFFSDLFDLFEKVLVRNQEDGQRFKEIGCSEEKIKVCGNLKLSNPPKLSYSVKLKSDSPVVVFGSTRDGEEEIITEYLEELMKSGKITPVFVPRHIERTEKIREFLESKGLKVILSEGKSDFRLKRGEVLIVNETGKLVDFYNVANLCFVGGSLVDKGGQNFAEPLFLGKPVVCGPYLDNFLDVKEILFDYFYIAENGRELKFFVENFLESPDIFKEKGQKAAEFLSQNAESLNCVLEELLC